MVLPRETHHILGMRRYLVESLSGILEFSAYQRCLYEHMENTWVLRKHEVSWVSRGQKQLFVKLKMLVPPHETSQIIEMKSQFLEALYGLLSFSVYQR